MARSQSCSTRAYIGNHNRFRRLFERLCTWHISPRHSLMSSRLGSRPRATHSCRTIGNNRPLARPHSRNSQRLTVLRPPYQDDGIFCPTDHNAVPPNTTNWNGSLRLVYYEDRIMAADKRERARSLPQQVTHPYSFRLKIPRTQWIMRNDRRHSFGYGDAVPFNRR